MSNIAYEYMRRNKDIRTYISSADDALSSIGYTEHSLAHVERAADTAYMILSTLGYPERDCELAQIAAYMHDIGSVPKSRRSAWCQIQRSYKQKQDSLRSRYGIR